MENTNKITFNQICNTAILRSGAMANKTSFELLENLALTLLEFKKYDVFSKEEFSKDFFNFYHLKMNSIVLGEVLNKLANKRIIKKKEKNIFQSNKNEINGLNSLSALESFSNEINLLVHFLIDYLNKHNYSAEKNTAERLLTKYIEENLAILGDPLYKNELLNSVEQYLMDSFVKELKDNSDDYYKIYKNILIGRLLAAFIVNNSDVTNERGTLLDKLVLFLDSGIVFRILGLDNYSTKEEYLDLISTLQGLGADIRIFRHIYNEVFDIIDGSKHWINNFDYSPGNASRVAEYFISNKYTPEDVDEYLLKLEDKLKSLNIHISDIEIDYNEPDSFGLYEENIFIMIKKQYEVTGYYQEDKEETYRLDAKSIFYIHKLRNGKKYRKISDAGYVLLTSNRGIAKVSRDCIPGSSWNLSYAITDAYLSLLLFFTYPSYSDETNMRFLIPAAYHAFKPSRDLLIKMETVLKELKEKGVMTEHQVFSWISNVTLGEEVVAQTNNNPEIFNEETPDMIIKKIKNDAEQSVCSIKREAKTAIDIANKKSDEFLEMYLAADEERKRYADELNKKDENEIEQLRREIALLEGKTTKQIKFLKYVFIVLFVLGVAAVLAGISYLVNYLSKAEKYQFIAYGISAIISIVTALISWKWLLNRFGILASKMIKNKRHNERILKKQNAMKVIRDRIDSRNEKK